MNLRSPAMSFAVIPLTVRSSSSVASWIRLKLPKCLRSRFFLIGPMPGMASRALVRIRLLRRLRWKPIARSWAASRIC